MRASIWSHFGLAAALRAERQDFSHALHRVGHVGSDGAASLAQLAGSASGRTRPQEWDNDTNGEQEGSQHDS